MNWKIVIYWIWNSYLYYCEDNYKLYWKDRLLMNYLVHPNKNNSLGICGFNVCGINCSTATCVGNKQKWIEVW